MKQFFALILMLCMLPHLAAACSFAKAEYIPDPTDYRTETNFYYYKINVTPDLHFVLSLVHPQTKQTVTQMRMKYVFNRNADPAATVAISKTDDMEVEFFTQSMRQVGVYDGTTEAPARMILRDSYSKFLTLDNATIDADYLTPDKVKPGAEVNGRLELIPDVWVLKGCIK